MARLSFVANFFTLLIFSLIVSSCTAPGSQLEGTWQLYDSKINQVAEESFTPLTWSFKGNGRFIQIMDLVEGELERGGKFEYDINEGELHLYYDEGSDRHVIWVVVHLDEQKMLVEYTGYGFFVEREFRKLP